VACDVIVSESGRLTIVCDHDQEIPQAALVQGGHLFLVRDGEHFHLGELAPSVHQQALKCTFAMFVVMEGFTVKSATEIRLQVD